MFLDDEPDNYHKILKAMSDDSLSKNCRVTIENHVYPREAQLSRTIVRKSRDVVRDQGRATKRISEETLAFAEVQSDTRAR